MDINVSITPTLLVPWKQSMDHAWLQARAVGLGLRVIYESLQKLPLSPVGTTVLAMHATHLEQGMAAVDRGVHLVGYTDRWIYGLQLDLDEIVESSDGFREWLSEHVSSARDMMLSFRKKGNGECFFLNRCSTDADQHLNEAIGIFRGTMRRARNVDQLLATGKQLLIQMSSADYK